MGANDWVVFGLTSSLDLKCKREEFVEPEVDLKRNSTQTRVKHGFNDERVAIAYRILAHTVFALKGDLAEAEPLYRKALSILDGHAYDSSSSLRAALQADLTELVSEDPRREREAYELASSSVKLFRQCKGLDNIELAWALNRLGRCQARRREYGEAEASLH